MLSFGRFSTPHQHLSNTLPTPYQHRTTPFRLPNRGLYSLALWQISFQRPPVRSKKPRRHQRMDGSGTKRASSKPTPGIALVNN